MALIICDARFREIDIPTKFDVDVTMMLRKHVTEEGLNRSFSWKDFGDKKKGVHKEVWVKYQETPGGPFLIKTFKESPSTHKQILIKLPG